MIFQNHSDGNLSKQTGFLLKHFALLNLIDLHSNQMTQLLILPVPYLKLLRKQYLNPRPVQNQRNLGLMMTVSRLLENENMPKDHLKNLPVIPNYLQLEFIGQRLGALLNRKRGPLGSSLYPLLTTGHL